MSEPVEVRPEDLSNNDALWLRNEEVDLTDPKIKLFRVEYAGETDILIKVSVDRGEIEIRLASGIVLIDNALRAGPLRIASRLAFRGDVAEPYDPENWKPWVITTPEPVNLAFTRYTTAGEATRAALRGWPWPSSWPKEYEPKLGVRPSRPPGETGAETFEGNASAWEPSPVVLKYLTDRQTRPYVADGELARLLERVLSLAAQPGAATAGNVDAAEQLVRKLRQNAVDDLVRSLEETDGQETT